MRCVVLFFVVWFNGECVDGGRGGVWVVVVVCECGIWKLVM